MFGVVSPCNPQLAGRDVQIDNYGYVRQNSEQALMNVVSSTGVGGAGGGGNGGTWVGRGGKAGDEGGREVGEEGGGRVGGRFGVRSARAGIGQVGEEGGGRGMAGRSEREGHGVKDGRSGNVGCGRGRRQLRGAGLGEGGGPWG